MKFLYAPTVLGLAVLTSLGSQSMASPGPAEPTVDPEIEQRGVPLPAEPQLGIQFGILSELTAAEQGEGPSMAEAPEAELNPGNLHGDAPRNWHDYYCPPCGRG